MTQSGLANYVYTPPSKLAAADWPTLQEFITSGKRFIMFMDYHANAASVPYILDEFSYFFETAYDLTSFANCNLDRPPQSSGVGLMYIVNHFKDIALLGDDDILIPDVAADGKTNAATGSGSIGETAGWCQAQWGKNPNVILLDNFEVGKSWLYWWEKGSSEWMFRCARLLYWEGEIELTVIGGNWVAAQNTLNGLS